MNRLALYAVAAYIFFQNFFKWIPFKPGTTAFKQSTLQDNIYSIIASLSLFTVLILVLARKVKAEFKPIRFDYVIGLFLIILFFQVSIRDAKAMEFVRSSALAASILSAIFVGKYFAASNDRLTSLLTTIKWALLGSVGLGLSVALTRPEVADWGGFRGAECLGTMLCRTEFFFFAVNPVFLTVLLWRNTSTTRRMFYTQLVIGLVIFALAITTRTRQFMLPILASAVLIFLLWAKNRRKVLYLAGGAVALACLFYGPTLLRMFLEYTRIVVEPSAIAVDPRAADWTSGRAALFQLLWNTFTEAPIFGVGGVEVRSLIDRAQLVAKTEHGFSFYPAAYGVFGLLFVGYILSAFAKGISILWRAVNGRIKLESHAVTLALIAVPLLPFGFFGIFGSATNPTDWISLCIATLVISLKVGESATAKSPVLRDLK